MRQDFIPVYGDEDDFQQYVLLDRLITERDGTRSCVAVKLVYQSPNDGKNLAEALMTLNPLHIFQINPQKAIVEFKDKNFLVIHGLADGAKNKWGGAAVGDYDFAMKFKADHGFDEDHDRKGHVTWHYSKKGNILERQFEIAEPFPIYDEFYPFIRSGIETYFDRYLNGRPTILVMIGEPGTGKTSLLRYLLWKRKLRATVTFDETVMKSEEYFLDYASDTDQDLMVIEDADLLLSSRESDQNKLMAKLLNLSEGLVRLDGKKMIFTTNLTNINNIDSALIRPGRCFDVLNFRALTLAEAKAAAAVAGITLAVEKPEMTLAELFHSARKKEEIEKFKLLKTA